jgi:hypothetical protein
MPALVPEHARALVPVVLASVGRPRPAEIRRSCWRGAAGAGCLGLLVLFCLLVGLALVRQPALLSP